MRNAKMISLTVAALLVSLSGCATVSASKTAPQSRTVCPLPTPEARLRSILSYLERAPGDPDLDTLAEEWERLDAGSRICRS